jgi:hypothetical protein
MQSESLSVLKGMNKAHNRRWGKEVDAGIAQQKLWAGALVVEHTTLQRTREAILDPAQLQAVMLHTHTHTQTHIHTHTHTHTHIHTHTHTYT